MKTKALTEGALMAAITVIAALLSYYLPIATILLFILPIPTILLCIRFDLRTGVLESVAASLLLFLFLDPINGLIEASFILLPGLALGYAYKKKREGSYRLFAGYLSYLVCLFLLIYLGQLITGVSFVDEYVQAIESSSKTALETMEAAGTFTAQEIESFKSSLDQMRDSLPLMLPTLLLILPFFMSYLALWICDLFLKRLHIFYQPMVPFAQWRLPRMLRSVLGLTYLGSALLQMAVSSRYEIYFMTIQFVCMIVFFMMGLSLIYWYTLRFRRNMGILIRILAIVLLFTMPGAIIFYMFLGIMDTFFPVREFLSRNRNE